MEENFKISVEKICPACSMKCPNFEIDSMSYYGESFCEGKVTYQKYFADTQFFAENYGRIL